MSLSDDPLSADITIYTFREGVTTFGASDASPTPDITLSGVSGEMCAVEHKVCVCMCRRGGWGALWSGGLWEDGGALWSGELWEEGPAGGGIWRRGTDIFVVLIAD